MKMAKPSEQDIDAAGDLMALLNTLDRGYYPADEDQENAPTFFDEEDPEHLRAFYDKVKATLDRAPGYQGRVIGGMCYVIMWDKNEIVDPDSDTIDLHPKLVKALQVAEQSATTAPAQEAAPIQKSLSASVADALRPFLGTGQKVIWREPFRWHDDDGVMPNHYEMFSLSGLAEDFGYTIIADCGCAGIIAGSAKNGEAA
jgi:hypothetical protein